MGIRTLDQFSLSPVSGGLPNLLDWDAYDFLYDWDRNPILVPSFQWAEVLNIQGEGYVNFFRVAGTSPYTPHPPTKIFVDNVQINVSVDASDWNVYDNPLLSLGFPVYFKESFRVEVFNEYVSNQSFYLDYTAMVKKNNPSNKQSYIDYARVEDVQIKTFSRQGTTFQTKLNVSGRSGYILANYVVSRGGGTSSDHAAFIELTVDGNIIVNNRRIHSNVGSSAKTQPFFIGPIPFNNDFILKVRTGASTDVWAEGFITYILKPE